MAEGMMTEYKWEEKWDTEYIQWLIQLYKHLPEKYEPFEPVAAENSDSQWTELLDKEMLQMHCGW